MVEEFCIKQLRKSGVCFYSFYMFLYTLLFVGDSGYADLDKSLAEGVSISQVSPSSGHFPGYKRYKEQMY